ncbi:MAG: VWA domain-containing protein [Pirellulales bacterium]|nr:VWA domain-containing protein [Pirellulales bacterium]
MPSIPPPLPGSANGPPLPIFNALGPTLRESRSSAWLISLVVHLLALILLSLSYTRGMPGGTPALSLSLSIGEDAKEGTDRDEGSQAPELHMANSERAQSSAATTSSAPRLDQILNAPPPVDPRYSLPAPLKAIGPSGLEGGQVGSAVGAESGRGGSGRSGVGVGTGPGGGMARTSVFGVPGEGYKFVYVFDRSGSMGGSGRNALSAAKGELLASLVNLQPNHQFQIIFYNENPTIFNPSGQSGRLAFATEQNKLRAKRFLGGILADGGTDHVQALQQAIAMRPDVIFLLTDADEPRLNPGQLARIHRIAAGTVINTIEFGYGPRSGGDNFLAQLARQNGGQYGYVDISKILPGGK